MNVNIDTIVANVNINVFMLIFLLLNKSSIISSSYVPNRNLNYTHKIINNQFNYYLGSGSLCKKWPAAN